MISSAGRRAPALTALAAAALLGACSDDAVVRVSTPAPDGDGAGPTEAIGGGVDGGGALVGGEGTYAPTVPGVGPPDEGTLANGDLSPLGTAPVPDAAVLPPGSRAGAYVGRLDDGDGVFVLDRQERLIGLATRPDGSAVSWFTDFSAGTASEAVAGFAHAADEGDASGAVSPLGRPAGAGPELGLVDGERIEQVSGETVVSLEASGRETLTPLTGDAIAGRWRAEHVDCDSLGEHCSTFTTSVELGAGTLVGASAVLTADGTNLFPVPMSGAFVPLGDFAEVTFEWNTYDYAGVMHFVPGDTERLVMIGRSDRVLADHPVVAFVLSRATDAS